MNSLGQEWQTFLLPRHKFLLKINYIFEVAADNTDAVYFAQTYNSQLIHGYFESDTISTIYICRCCSGLTWYILFTNITIHANTHMFIQMIKMLLSCFMK